MTPPEDRAVPELCSPIAACLLGIMRYSWEPSHPACPASGGSSGCPPQDPHGQPEPPTPKFPMPCPISSLVSLCSLEYPLQHLLSKPGAVKRGRTHLAGRGAQVALISLNGPDEPHWVLPATMDLRAHFSSAARRPPALVLATLS